MKACKYCSNGFEDDQMEMHETLCAKNPDVAEKARRAGEMETYKKTCVITGGKISRLYWAHSAGEKDFTDELPHILEVWREKWPEEEHHSMQFLRERGFRVQIQ